MHLIGDNFNTTLIGMSNLRIQDIGLLSSGRSKSV
jgi:hypothetical protein